MKRFPAVDRLIAETHGLMQFMADVQRRRPLDGAPIFDFDIIHAKRKEERAAIEAAGADATTLEEFERRWAGLLEEAHRLNTTLSRLR